MNGKLAFENGRPTGALVRTSVREKERIAFSDAARHRSDRRKSPKHAAEGPVLQTSSQVEADRTLRKATTTVDAARSSANVPGSSTGTNPLSWIF
jgi:hypothetical protein